jgi:phosphoglucomutase
MQNLMNELRTNAPAKIGEYNVSCFKDYKTSEIKNIKTGEISGTGLPKSDVLYYDLENGSKVIIRPSGTEPKIKIYYLINAPDEPSASAQIDALKSAMANLMK